MSIVSIDIDTRTLFAGLYMMLIAGIAFAAIIAICEFTWRKRKLAVDENVSVS